MILDDRNEFCDAVLLNTGAAATYNLGDVIDLGAVSPSRDLGGDMALFLVINVDTAITTAGAAGTLAFQLVSDAQDPFLTNGTQTVHALSRSFVTGSTPIPAGTSLFAIQLPMEGAVYERYLGIQQITGTTAINAGRINAFLTEDVARWKAYDSPSQA
jgi:hypothetical protein